MKRILLIIFTVLLLSACTKANEQVKAPDIITTNFPIYDFTSQIAGDVLDVRMLLPPGGESHTYEPTPKDIIDIENCKLFIYIGGKSDSWIDEILESVDTKKTTVLNLMDVCTPIEHHKHDNSQEYDEHIWTSPKNAIKMTEAIYEAVCKIDSINIDLYKENLDGYLEELYLLDKELLTLSDNSESKMLIFADRFPFSYLARDYGFDYISPFTGCSEQIEPSIAEVNGIIDEVLKQKSDTVFYIEFSNQKLADTICEATGAKKALLHSCHNVTTEEFNLGITYFELMNNNINTLREALN